MNNFEKYNYPLHIEQYK